MKSLTWTKWLWIGIALMIPANGLILWSLLEYGSIIRNPVGILGVGLELLVVVAFRKAADQKELIDQQKK